VFSVGKFIAIERGELSRRPTKGSHARFGRQDFIKLPGVLCEASRKMGPLFSFEIS
jgi:hypothetical protein